MTEVSDEQAEEIVLMHRLTGKPVVDCAYAVIVDFDRENFVGTLSLQIKITEAVKRLDKEFKRAHSQHTQQGESNAEET